MADDPVASNILDDEQDIDLCDLDAAQARIQQLKQTVVDLDDSAQAFKLLTEKQAAEINAKEILLTRKTEYVNELLEQIKVLTLKFDAKVIETQTLELGMEELNTQMNELREQIKKDEEDFAMVCAALDAREKLIIQKNGELTAAKDNEKDLTKELNRKQGIICRLEKNVEDLQPEKVDACLSPRSFRENQLIRLRDEAIETKTREVWLLSGQNDQLRVQLDDQKSALEQLQRNVILKENDLVRQQQRNLRLEAKVDALQTGRSLAEEREKAMEIVTTQNDKLLQALEAQERKTEELKARLDCRERECEKLRSSLREHIVHSADNEVEVLLQTKQAEKTKLVVSALQEKVRRERKVTQEEVSSSFLKYQMEIDKLQSELVMRRNKQYELTHKLLDVEARLHETTVCRECAEEQLLACQCRMRELERVLQDSFEWKRNLETELAMQRANADERTDKLSKMLAEVKREFSDLQNQHEGMEAQLNEKLVQAKQQKVKSQGTEQLLNAQKALNFEQKGRIEALVKEVTRESQIRAAVEVETAKAKNQLKALRQQIESTIQECADQERQSQDKNQRLARRFTDLVKEFHVVQSAKSKVVMKYMDMLGKATTACYSRGVMWPFPDNLDLRGCWLLDDDLPPILSMLDSEGVKSRLRRVDLRFNRLTREGMGSLLVFLKNTMLNAASHPECTLREFDLRQNCISLDAIRLVAEGLETLIFDKNTSPKVTKVKSVTVTNDGKIEVYAGCVGAKSRKMVETSSLDALLVVDFSENHDTDWLHAASRRFKMQNQRRKAKFTDASASANNCNNIAAAHPKNGVLGFKYDNMLEEIYGVDLVQAFMGHDKSKASSHFKSSVYRSKSVSTDISANALSPMCLSPPGSTAHVSLSTKHVNSASPHLSNGLEVSSSHNILPAVENDSRECGMSPRLVPPLSLPKLAG